ncbi:MAG: sigma-70 family RNA polymerase sigma factor [Planctomycetota bacterium]
MTQNSENASAVARGNRETRALEAGSAGVWGTGESDDTHKLTSLIARGDNAAFERFYEVYFARLHRYLLLVSHGSEDLVHEVLQEAMLRVVRHMKPFREATDLWNWLRSLAKSALVDMIRKSARHTAVSIEDVERELVDNAHANPDRELERRLEESLARLDVTERRLIEGKYFQAKSHESLAREEGLTPKAVESRIARIRKRLKAMLLEGFES